MVNALIGKVIYCLTVKIFLNLGHVILKCFFLVWWYVTVMLSNWYNSQVYVAQYSEMWNILSMIVIFKIHNQMVINDITTIHYLNYVWLGECFYIKIR